MNNSNFFYILIILFLSSCASYNPNTFSSKSPFSGGIYKIGDPYSIEEKVFFPKEELHHGMVKNFMEKKQQMVKFII